MLFRSEGRHEGDDNGENDCLGTGQAILAIFKGVVVDKQADHGGGVVGATAGHHVSVHMPGVAAYDSIMMNHCMTMSPIEGGGCNKACDASLLEGNPIHQDMKESAALLDPDFLLNTVFTQDFS